MKVKILLSLIVVALLSVSATAGEFLDVNQPVHTTGFGGPSDGTVISQSFITGINTYYIYAIEMQFYGWETLPATSTLSLRASGDPGPWESGTLLGSKTNIFPGPFTYPDTWVNFTFDSPIAVTPGNTYIFFMENTVGAWGTAYASGTDPYADGYLALSISGGAWNHYYAHDMSFRVYGWLDESKAKTPTPASPSTVDVPEGSTLSWLMGEDAVTHQVYWSDDQDAVVNRSVTPIILTQAVDGNTTPTPSTPVRGKTYYWAVDEVNSLPVTAEGPLWQYTIKDFIYVDDFEAYDGSLSSGNDVWEVWEDGYFGSSGSAIHSEIDGADGTAKAMEYIYSNDGTSPYGGTGYPYYSEIVANTSDPCLSCGSDWTAEGIAWLELKFKGQAGNDANERMYVGIEDSVPNFAMVQYGLPDTTYSNPSWPEDMNNINDDVWRSWGIDLRAFTGVNLADVQKVYVGFGERGNITTPGGGGTVIFDEFKLRSPGIHSIPDVWAEDLYNDGTINFKDLAVLAGRYLDIESDGTWPQL